MADEDDKVNDVLGDMKDRVYGLQMEFSDMKLDVQKAIKYRKFDEVEAIEDKMATLYEKEKMLSDVGRGILKQSKEQYPDKDISHFDYAPPTTRYARRLFYRDGTDEIFFDTTHVINIIQKKYEDRGGDMEYRSGDGFNVKEIISDHVCDEEESPDVAMILKTAGVKRIVIEAWTQQ